jgi:hypothetical protein
MNSLLRLIEVPKSYQVFPNVMSSRSQNNTGNYPKFILTYKMSDEDLAKELQRKFDEVRILQEGF